MNNICETVHHVQLNSVETVTPPPTQVEAVELVNRIAERKEVQFKLTSDAIKKLKSNWGRKVAKQQHKQCNEMAMKIAKMQKIRAKSASRMQKRVEERRSRREAREEAEQVKKGTAVMDSGAMSSVFRPEDDEYVVIDTNVPSRKIFTMATGEKSRASTIAKLKRNPRGVAGFGDKVPDLQNNSLVSTSKLADENYSTLFTPTEVLVFDGEVEIEPKRVPV
jgi:hypothetical protein